MNQRGITTHHQNAPKQTQLSGADCGRRQVKEAEDRLTKLPAAEVSRSFHCESQQHVTGYLVVMTIARVHEHHAAGHRWTSAIQRAAFGRYLVYSGKLAQGVIIPQHPAVLA